MKKIVISMVMMLVIGIMSGCGSNQVEEVNAKIDVILSTEEISQKQLEEMFSAYEQLSEEQKKEVTRYSEVKKYKDVNIEKVNAINKSIDIIHTLSFIEIVELQENIDKLSEREQKFINIEPVNSAMELTDMEKSAVAACQYIKKSLKSSDSFKLKSVKVINDLDAINYYLVKIEYSATNGFGAEIDSNSFQTINRKFENPWWGLAVLNGKYEEALECSSFLSFYLTNEQEPTVLDSSKILYYIDEKVN